MSDEVRRDTRDAEARSRVDAEPDRHSDDSEMTAESNSSHNIDPKTGIHVSLRVPDRPTLHDALRSLVEADVPFEINRISDAGAHSSLAIVDMDEFTEKQREALELAFEHGYYETPREGDLETISDELGISRSAVSQRLRAIESKLVYSILVEQTGEDGR